MNVQKEIGRPRFARWAVSLAVAALLFVALLGVVAPASAQTPTPTPGGYYYTIQEGDSWTSVAAEVGVSVEALKAANPEAVNENDWLISGEQLFVPTATAVETLRHTVGGGESWNSIADKYNISVDLLMAANPNAIRPGEVLYRGERLIIPPAESASTPVTATVAPTEEPTAEASEEASEEATVEPTETPAEEATATPEEEATADATPKASATSSERGITVPAGATPTTTVEAEGTPTPMPEESAEITETGTLTELAEITASVTLTASAPLTESAALTASEVLTGTEPATTTETITEDGPEGDSAAAGCPVKFTEYADALLDASNSDPGGADAVTTFLSGCQADVADGLATVDLTGDGVDDLVIVYINPNQQSSFVEGDLVILVGGAEGYTLAYRARAAGEVRLLATEDINLDDQMDVVWVDTTCGASTCFDTVNVRSWDGAGWIDWTDGTITMAYAEIAVEDLSEAGQGSEIQLTGGIYGSVGAGPQRSRIELWGSVEGAPYSLLEKTYSESECLYHVVLDANRGLLDAPELGFDAPKALYERALTDNRLIKCWVRENELDELRSFSLFRLALIDAYQGEVEAANDRIAQLGTDFPDSIYAQVGQVWLDAFTPAQDMTAACEAVTTFADENAEAWEILADYGYTNPTFEAFDVCPALEIDAPDSGGEETGASGATPSEPVSEAASAPALAVLPLCPNEIAGYTDLLPELLAVTDEGGIKAFLTQCGALDTDRGALTLADLNGDDIQDAVVFPTAITNLGLGPEGVEGAVLVFHGAEAGSYTLAANPDVYGQPALVTVEDLNADGLPDLAWTVTACSTFCVVEVQGVTWDAEAEEYRSIIGPGAAIAEGEVSIEPVPEGDPGAGSQIVLVGGVSGTPEGGLAVAHTEVWQSVDGAPFGRVRWTYERDAAQSDCLGLRLVEADVALQASGLIGLEAARDLYAAALEDELAACSLFDLEADEELDLLHGLARFRLIQILALNDETDAVDEALTAMQDALPESLYTEAAGQWLEAFTGGATAADACAEVAPIFVENDELWQVTDHFGFSHPALAAEAICFVPAG